MPFWIMKCNQDEKSDIEMAQKMIVTNQQEDKQQFCNYVWYTKSSVNK